MISLCLLFLALSSGGILCAAVANKRYEQLLPITCSGIVLWLFAFGIAGNLEMGVVILCVVCVAIYAFTFWSVRQRRNWREICSNIFTPGFLIFVCFFFSFCIFEKDLMLSAWDEFTHWGDIVKVMVSINDFGTAANSNSIFQSYPPGMSLFQYFVQKLYIWISGEEISEWRIFLAYSLFASSFFMPFTKEIKGKNPFQLLATAGIIFFSPFVFFSTVYTRGQVDAFLSILSAAAFLMIFWHKKSDWVYIANILLICSILVLVKDVGLLFAIFIGIAFLVDIYIDDSMTKKRKIVMIPLVSAFIFLPCIFWKINIYLNSAVEILPGKFDFKRLIKVLFNQDDSYLVGVKDSYFKAFFIQRFSVGEIGITISYFVLFAILFMLCILLMRKMVKKNKDFSKRSVIVLLCILGVSIVYIIGLLATYMFKLTRYEAEILASFTRYIHVIYSMLWLFMIISYLIYGLRLFNNRKNLLLVILLSVVFIMIPQSEVYAYLSRKTVKISINFREQYMSIIDEIKKYTDGDDAVYFIAQEDNGISYLVTRYSIRPNTVEPPFECSIGKPFYDGDIRTIVIEEQEWQKELKEKYDYVALYKLNEYFYNNFSNVFKDKTSIREGTVYRVDKENGMLEECK